MRKATTIKPIMWMKPGFRDLSPNARFVFLFLISGPGTSLSGLVAYPTETICSCTGLASPAVKKAMAELVETRRIFWDEQWGLILLLRWIKHNPVNSKLMVGALHEAAAYEYHRFSQFAEYLINGGDPDTLSDTLSDRVPYTPQGQGQGQGQVKTLEEVDGKAAEVLEYLNQVTGKNFRTTTNIEACLSREKCGVDDCKIVIDFKWNEWAGTSQQKFVDPTTPFRKANFMRYLDQAMAGPGFEGTKTTTALEDKNYRVVQEFNKKRGRA